MTSGSEPAKAGSGKTWLPSAKKFAEFILSVLEVKRSVESLKKQNAHLEDELRRLQRQVDEQAGQLKSIQLFIQTSIYDQAARSGERAAMAAIQHLLAQDHDRE